MQLFLFLNKFEKLSWGFENEPAESFAKTIPSAEKCTNTVYGALFQPKGYGLCERFFTLELESPGYLSIFVKK